MLKKNDQMKIMYLCLNMMEFCKNASKTIVVPPIQTEDMQKICEGLSRLFLSFGEDFKEIGKLVMKGFTKKEIKTLMAKPKKDFKKHKQEDTQ